ncbi:hypothetical protein JCM11641_002874 [Rhodosporidiobolus odoratus]
MFPRQPTPPPFLRRPSSTSSSSFLSTTTDDSSDESSTETDSEDGETEGYYSSSGISGDEGRFIRRLDASLNGGNGPGGAPRFADQAGKPGAFRSGTSSSARSDLKLSLAVLRARHALAAQQYEALAAALKALAAALPPLSTFSSTSATGKNAFGVFLPILDRLAKDVRATLADEDKGRGFRRAKLSKEDAKALVALRQRWSGTGRGDGGGKGKGKESDADWVSTVGELVSQKPPPSFLADKSYSSLTPALLTSLEFYLLPSALLRLSLSNLGLQDHDLQFWPALRRLPEVVGWYLSFAISNSDEAESRAKTALEGVRSLDLSKNKLTTFPLYLTRLLPSLETLSLSHNEFPHLPAWATLFSSLRRLRTHGNRLINSRKALKPLANGRKAQREKAYPRLAGSRANVREVLVSLRRRLEEPDADQHDLTTTSAPSSLVSISTQLAQSCHSRLPRTAFEDELAAILPSHLSDLVLSSYECASCMRFILANNPLHVPPFLERVHHLDPGIALPSRVPPPPARSASPPLNANGNRTPPMAPSYAERPATIEQRVLLALIARIDARPPPPPRRPSLRRASSTTSLSSLASTSTTSNGPPRRRPTRRERDWQNGKAIIPTLVVGGAGEQGDGYRFCVPCAAAHLGLDAELAAAGLEWTCRCFVCSEEKRVREGEPAPEEEKQSLNGHAAVQQSKAKVMRWLRRKERMGKVSVPPGGLRIA